MTESSDLKGRGFGIRLGKWLLSVTGFALVYYAAARLGLVLAFASTNASPVWPPSGIALGVLLLFGYRLWPGIFIGAFAANFAVFAANHVAGGFATTCVSLVIASGNTLEALVGAYLLRHLVGAHGYFTKTSNIYKFLLVAALAGAVSASVGTCSLLVGSIAPVAAQWSIWSIWWLGDISGMLVVTPLLLAWSAPFAAEEGRRSWLAIAASLIGLTILLAVIFGQKFSVNASSQSLAYFLLPCIGWAAYRYGRRGETLVLVVITGTAVWCTTHGLGPFASGTLQESLGVLKMFIAMCSVVGLVLAADISERKRMHGNFSLGRHTLPLVHWITLYICLGLTVVAWHLISGNTQRRAQDRFDYIAENVKKRIDERMDVYQDLLHAGQALFSASKSVERDEWQRFAERLNIQEKFPGVLGIGYAKLISPAEKGALEQKARAEGLPDFHVWPEGDRREYAPINYFEPSLDQNRRAFGYDMLVEPSRNAAMIQARNTGDASITRKLSLAQEIGEDARAGFLMYLPVYRNGAKIDTQNERMAAIEGYVYSPFQMSDLMRDILGQSAPEVALQIYDGNEEDDAALMYSSELRTRRSKLDYPNAFTVRKTISILDDGQNWTVRITSLPAFEATIDRQKSLIVLVTGTMISLLFFGVVGSLSSTREKAQALANEMTAALKETNRTLRQSEERFRLLTSSVKDYAIILLDPRGLVLTWNEGAQRLKGYTEEEIVGRSFECFYLAEDIAAGMPRRALEYAREHGLYENAGWRLRKDGTQFYADAHLTAIRDDQNELIGFAKITRDITQERRVEHELRSAKEQAESANRAKGEFVANMSHELRTPMNAVLGMTYLLGGSPLSSDQKKYLDMIRVSGQSLLDILNDILDFSKIDAGRMELSPSQFHLGDLLNAIATIMSVNAGEKDLELALGVDPEVPRMLIGDALRLQQILINLAGNAIKFTERGEVSIHVEIASRQADMVSLRFRVCDTGIGMNAEQQSRLFSPFTQADSSMTRRFGGTGLGLTICGQLVGLMGGTIEMRSELGKGSEFCATIPFQVASDQKDPKRLTSAMNNLHILIVDDNQTSRDCILQTTQAWNWQADCAVSGEQAIECVRSSIARNQPYDVVLSDWQMSGMDGVAAMQAIRELLPEKSLPVILMVSAFGRGKLMRSEAAAQANAILIKPVTGSSLFDAVHEAVAGLSDGSMANLSDPNRFLAPYRLDGICLLLAEDNAMNQVVAKGMLEYAGATVDIVENGQMAVDLLRTAAQRYQLVLMDIQMPVMDGFAATRLIRSELGLTLPVLAMTAGVTESERVQCIDAGMDDFIAKPIDVGQMFATILRYLPSHKDKETGVPVADIAAQQDNNRYDGLPVLDLDQLLFLVQANPAYKATLVSLLRNIVEKDIVPINNAQLAWDEERHREAARLFHSMRGEIGTMGAKRFARVTLDIEDAITNNETERVACLFEVATHELNAAISAMREWLAVQIEPEMSAAGKTDLDMEQIKRLHVLLHENNMEACEVYAAIRPALPDRIEKTELSALDEAMDRLNFNEAIDRLESAFPA